MFAEDKKKKVKTTKTIKKAKGRADEDLFGNTDDIFGDLPASKPKGVTKGKKSKKKTGATTKTATADDTPPTEGKQYS